ncbi:permease family protein [Lactobacillus selangorensis]|uniref:Putative hemin transport system permease protein HrtB n=1 Tax=Lactobacillus selangorensis TaxID=81857 RepID=A0A0R2FWU1_9LACO|nr:ABC transporter permease [Lactobacillus selangorensis]KRN28757.1 permease family protein [Lactobacillus selangorensis]KRN32833.1 permease family protein [Lactobacillus selangorensis]
MYLATHELKANKGRYALVILVLFLIAYLIYFLTGLAYGLAADNRLAVDQWGAARVGISKYADSNLAASTIPASNVNTNHLTKNQAPLGEMAAVVTQKGHSKDIDATVFGIKFDSFIKPKLIKGHQAKNDHQIVVDEQLDDGALKLGDQLHVNGNKTDLKIVGFTKGNLYGTLPVVFTTLKTYNLVKYTNADLGNISGVVYKKTSDVKKLKDVKTITINTMIQNIPGYSAQNSTFSLMIGALFVIVLFIVAIFMYILTIQNISVYGIMRAQGISNGTLIHSVIAQSLILGIVGIGLGLIANQLTVLILPAAMPYSNNGLLVGGFSIGLLLMVVLGSVFSIRQILKIDPIRAIGGAE